MVISFLRTFIILCGFTLTLHAQKGKLLFHQLTLEEGLSEQTNYFIYKDTKGFVWISSINGLNRYDGTGIKVYLPDPEDSTAIVGENIQSSFFEDRLSNLWFTTFDAINCYDRKHDSFSHYTLSYEDNEPLPGYHIFYYDGNEHLWLLLTDTIFTFNITTKKFQPIAPVANSAIRATVVENTPGNIQYIFTYRPNHEGMSILHFENNHYVNQKPFVPATLPHLIPRKLLNEGDSVIWIGAKAGLIRYDLRSNAERLYPGESIITVGYKDDNTLLVSVADKGVWEFDKHDFALSRQYKYEEGNPFGLLSNKVITITKDHDNVIWMTTSGFGINYASPDKIKFSQPIIENKKDSTGFQPNAHYEELSGRVLACTSPGKLFMMDRNGTVIRQLFASVKTYKPEMIYRIFKDSKTNIWLSTFNGLYVIPADSETILQVTDKNKIMWNAVELKNGRLLFSANPKGIYEVALQNGVVSLTAINSHSVPNECMLIAEDRKGRLLISELLQKLVLVDPVTFDLISEIPVKGIITHFIENEKENTAWVSSSTGLYELDMVGDSIRNIYNQFEKSALLGFSNMLQDSRGRLWMSLRNQIAVFDPTIRKFTIYNQEDGLDDTQYSSYGAYRFPDGEMWFPAAGAVTRFYPDDIAPISAMAIPQITFMFINDLEPKEKMICEETQATNITEIQKLKFSYRENTLSFILNSLEYSAPRHNKVKYLMEGIDKEWIEILSGTLVRYPALPAGKFTLQVQAANSDGVYHPAIRRLEIVITPPFYKTWWFILLSSLAFLTLVIYIVYLNFSKTIELQKVRIRLYENLHDDIGSGLTAIVTSAGDLLHQESNPKLERITSIAKNIMGNMRRLVWAIDPGNDTLASLVSKIRSERSLILQDHIAFHIDLAPQLNQVIVPGEIRYQIISIVNEALTNVSKYASAKNVWLQFSKTNSHLQMVIRDDGVGFNRDDTGLNKVQATGYGLGNMHKRAVRVKGNMTLHSTPGAGTTIEVNLPLK